MRLEEDQESGEFGPTVPQRRCCRFSCTCLASSLPVIFIWAIIAWSYYVYVIAMCGFVITNNFERIMYIAVYHPILFLFLWTYVQTIFTKPIAPPSKVCFLLLSSSLLLAFLNIKLLDVYPCVCAPYLQIYMLVHMCRIYRLYACKEFEQRLRR